jgi:hypothetical protein
MFSRLYGWVERLALYILAMAALGTIGVVAMRWLT